MALQTFTAGQVLTAAQMTSLQANDYNQTVSTKTASYTLVAADKGTRVVMNSASATTITVNTSLFSAADTLILQNIGAGVCTVTAGTATVSSAGPLAIPQNGSGVLYFTSAGVSIYYPSAVTASAAGLVPIVPTSITVGGGTATASANGQVTMTSVTTSILLNGVFSSTYTNYRFVWNGVGASSYNLTGRLSVGGSVSSASDYLTNQIYSSANVVYAQNLAAATSFDYRAGASTQISFTADVIKPFVANPTTILGVALGNDTAGTGAIPYLEAHYNKAATSYDGIQFLVSAAVTGTLSVYGYTI